MTDLKELKRQEVRQLATRVLALALNDKACLDRLCKEFEPNAFPKGMREFAKIVWAIPHGMRARLTQDVLNDHIKTAKYSTEVGLTCSKVFLDCQAVKINPGEFEYFLPKLKEYRADAILRETLRGVDEDDQLIYERDGTAKKGIVDLIKDGKPFEAADTLKSALASVQSLSQSDQIIRVELTERAPAKIAEYEHRKTHQQEALGLLTGFGPLDDVTRGIGAGELALFAGASGAGKSICLLNAGKTIFKAKKNVMLFSLEMAYQQYEDRFISSYAGIHNERMLIGALTTEEEAKLKNAWEEVHGMSNKFEIVDFPKIDSFTIETELSRAIDKYHPDVVLIDYLGIMKPNDKSSIADWEQQGKISDEVRTVARLYRIPIISAVQLNRSKTKEKSLDRLSRSSMIANNSDVVVMINDDQDKQAAAMSDLMKYTVIKNRKGADGFEFEMYKNFSTITLDNLPSYKSRLQNLMLGTTP